MGGNCETPLKVGIDTLFFYSVKSSFKCKKKDINTDEKFFSSLDFYFLSSTQV